MDRRGLGSGFHFGGAEPSEYCHRVTVERITMFEVDVHSYFSAES